MINTDAPLWERIQESIAKQDVKTLADFLMDLREVHKDVKMAPDSFREKEEEKC